jgi:hypothetical protein
MCIGSEGQYSQPHVLTTSQKPNEGLRLFPDKSHVSHGAALRYARERPGTGPVDLNNRRRFVLDEARA